MADKRIADNKVVFHVIPTLGSGGAEAVLADYISNDCDSKHCVVTLFKTPSSQFFDIDSADDYVGLEFNLNPFKALYRLVKLLGSNKGSVVFLWTYYACVFAPIFSFYNWNIIFSIHHSLSDYKNEKSTIKLAINLIRSFSTLKSVRKILYVSDVSKFGHEEFGFPSSKSVRIDNGLVLKGYKDQRIAKLNRPMSRRFIVGHAARYHPIKNHRLFLESLRFLLDKGISFRAILAGQGVDRTNSELMADIVELGLDNVVDLRGEINDMPAFYSEIDVFALTSRAESAPRVILEALACGVPVISTDVGDANGMIDAFGIVADDNSDSIGAAIISQADRLRCDTSISESAYQYVVQKYSIEHMISAYSSLIEEVRS